MLPITSTLHRRDGRGASTLSLEHSADTVSWLIYESYSFLLGPGMYDYLNTIWSLNQGKPKHFTGQNAVDVTTKHSLDMLDEAIKAGGQFFMTVAPAIPHLGLNATGKGTHAPIPQKKWKNAFQDAIVPRGPNWNPAHAR